VERIEVLDWEAPRLRLRVTCGAGTYVRSLARDIGAVLGTGGYLHALRRIASGTFGLDEAVPLAALKDADDVRSALLPLDRAIPDWPAVLLTPEEERFIVTGRPIAQSGEGDGKVRLYDSSGELVALGRLAAGQIRPIRVFRGGSA
jgi:tRNA pseudouridine55 synthase